MVYILILMIIKSIISKTDNIISGPYEYNYEYLKTISKYNILLL